MGDISNIMNEIRENNIRSQKDAVKYILESRGFITSNDAIYGIGATRLSAIIWDLRHNDKWNIKTHKCVGKNRFGNIGQYAKYELIKED